MFEFWNQESRLASSTLGRLTQLLAVLYSTSTERHFLCNSTNLLLELTSRSPDYNRSIFDQPLSDCKFEVCFMYVVSQCSSVHVIERSRMFCVGFLYEKSTSFICQCIQLSLMSCSFPLFISSLLLSVPPHFPPSLTSSLRPVSPTSPPSI